MSVAIKHPYLFQWSLGDFRFIGPFPSDEDAIAWGSRSDEKHNDPNWQLMHLDPEVMTRYPTLLEVYQDGVIYPTARETQTFLCNTYAFPEAPVGEMDPLEDALHFWILRWTPDKTTDRIMVTGPFPWLLAAREYGRGWQDAIDDNPCWTLCVFYDSELTKPVSVLAPEQALTAYPLHDMRLPA